MINACAADSSSGAWITSAFSLGTECPISAKRVCQLKALVGAGVGLLVVGRTVRGIAGKVGTIVGGGAGKVGMMAGATFGIGKLLSAAVTLLVLYVG